MRSQCSAQRQEAGLSLVESLFTLLVFAVALLLTVGLFARYGRVLAFQDGHSRLVSLMVAGQRMCEEIETARALQVSSGVLRISKFDPSRFSRRLDQSPEAAPFAPYSEEYLIDVTFRVERNQLMRTVTRGAISEGACLADEVDAFAIDEQPKLLYLQLDLKSTTKKHQAKFVVRKPS